MLANPIHGASAAPSAIECRDNARLTAPVAGAVITGVVEIRGRAVVGDFKFYKVEFAPVGLDKWTLIGPEVIFVPVESGLLVVWQSTIVADGAYRLRLQVVDKSGNYCEAFITSIIVANRNVVATETPAPTETAVLTAVPPGPTTTPRNIVIQTVVAPPTQSIPLAPRSGTGAALPDLNVMVYGAFFVCGAALMSSFIGLIALFMFMRQKAGR